MEVQDGARILVRLQVDCGANTVLDLTSILRVCVEGRKIELQVAKLEKGGEIILGASDHGRPGGGLHRSGGVGFYIERSMGGLRKRRRLQWEQ